MSPANTPPAIDPALLSLTPLTPVPRRRGVPWRLILTLTVMAGLPASLWAAGFRPQQLWKPPKPLWTTVTVDRGTIETVVVESGTLESANNTTVRCKVEAMIGVVGGGQGSGSAGTGTQGTGGTTAGSSTSSTTTTVSTVAGSAAATTTAKPATTATTSTSAASATTSVSSVTSSSPTITPLTSTTSTDSTTTTSTDSTTTTDQNPPPTITSFSYTVPKYVPLRPLTGPGALPKKVTAQQVQQQQQSGRGGGMGMDEKPGSTRILTIKPEGTFVKAGEVVCELDSAAFRDEAQAQRIKYIQAKSYVDQARALYEVNKITLREYRDGIYPQDLQLIRDYIATCQIDEQRTRNNYFWSLGLLKKGIRPLTQFNADKLAWERSKISLRESERMLERLEKFTAPRLIKDLEAKLEANRADLFAQEAAFELEKSRLERLERMIEYCTLRAPIDGIVVYVQPANNWGRVEQQIGEGVTVRENQPIFSIPDPDHMQVKVKVNETKLSFIHSGQKAKVLVDAFPEKILPGTVSEITAIPAPANMGSDVRLYYANVRIDTSENKRMRPGMTAEVTFELEARPDVVRIPLKAVRWVGQDAFAAVPTSDDSYTWRPLEIGLMDAEFAEVVSGLEPGDRVIDQPDLLTPPTPAPQPYQTVAAARP
jgi:HlyD family secretion protein